MVLQELAVRMELVEVTVLKDQTEPQDQTVQMVHREPVVQMVLVVLQVLALTVHQEQVVHRHLV